MSAIGTKTTDDDKQMGLSVTGVLEPAVAALIQDGVNTAAKKWGIDLPKGMSYSYDKTVSRLGNRHLAERSRSTYDEHYKQFMNYCALKGDYDSMLIILLPATFTQVPTVLASTAEEFVRLKRSPRNTEIVATDGMPVMDVLGAQIFSDGSWNAPGKAAQFQSAINNLCEEHGHRGEYTEECKRCMSLTGELRRQGCDWHVSTFPQLQRAGNTTNSTVMKNTMRKSAKDGANWVEKGDTQLLPCDLRAIRTYLLSNNGIIGVQSWTIALLAVKLFLRPDEVLSIRMDDVLDNLIIRKDGHVHSVTINVMGKSDKQNVALQAIADDDNPDFCPVRMLLVYVHLCGIKKGWLFPAAKELIGEKGEGKGAALCCIRPMVTLCISCSTSHF